MGQTVTGAQYVYRIGSPRSPFRLARNAIAAVAFLLNLATTPALAQEEPRIDDEFPPAEEPITLDDMPLVDEPPVVTEVEDIVERLDGIESQLERLDEKLDRLEALLRAVHGERLRRAEMLTANPELATAIRNLAERHGIARIDEYLVADDTARVAALAKKLARASAERGPLAFCSDPDVARVVGAIASRRDYMAERGQRLVVSIAGREAPAVGALVERLLDLPSPSAHEAALRGAPFGEGKDLAERLSSLAADLRDRDDEDVMDDNAPLTLLAQAAAASHGDRAAEDAMAELVRSRSIDGAFAWGVAENLRAAGSVVALRVYVELVLDKKYAYAAAQAFTSINGFGRIIGWREIKDGREALHEELTDWLRRNRANLRPDRGRFRLEKPAK